MSQKISRDRISTETYMKALCVNLITTLTAALSVVIVVVVLSGPLRFTP